MGVGEVLVPRCNPTDYLLVNGRKYNSTVEASGSPLFKPTTKLIVTRGKVARHARVHDETQYEVQTDLL